ncbi:M48 family metalloprotease [Massilia dura]|uniref:M48 family metalloprotease n=1 Tax=Pseudoduganella dura TaxID=321982 RepID=A0A6I3XIE4_9BURK|nr:M48 family metalloprotease [Pseudoduganella dura]MUI11465.1 M48 family metalloprotease [Pseudoduganella dura]GGX97541.1 hypothetical protein GCM10007386_30640 [Pseudoduganella dura]
MAKELHQWYPRMAKYLLGCSLSALLLSMLAMGLGQHGFVHRDVLEIAGPFLVVAGLPLLVAIRFFHDPIEMVWKKYNVTANEAVASRVNGLLKETDGDVRIGQYPAEDANAFAISSVRRGRALIAFSSTLIASASQRQLLAIAAHEIAHLRNGDSRNKVFILAFNEAVRFYPWLLSGAIRDMFRMIWPWVLALTMVLAAVTGFVQGMSAIAGQLLGWFEVLARIAKWPLLIVAGYLVLNWLLEWGFHAYSREREFAADAAGAALTSRAAMIDALSLFTDTEPAGVGVFDTHPSLGERKRRLLQD